MANVFEELLHEKTKGTPSDILAAQWNYDKRIIPSALQLVSNLFPHYSLHDESHSLTILNNIIRVLGKDNIAKLSAIDIWLILEAAYCHDIGMVVPHDKIVDALNSSEFIDFFTGISIDKNHALNEFAAQFTVKDGKIVFKESVVDFEQFDSVRFILADYFRTVHAERSKEIIVNPTNELSLVSPRGVMPQRIFRLLADICSCHTKDFADIMRLPFCEVGIDIEDAHPRFIACLLRIGDLLDLDNNRFSEVMLRTLSKVPVETLKHKAKHMSIELFRVDKITIEITARCKDYDTASITQHWFNYLNSEISQQMINWNAIVPTSEFGYLPTIGSLKVELLEYDYIDGKTKPQFTVDTEKALELLSGAGIYEGAHQCIREILQNATDATLLRIWLEHSQSRDFLLPDWNTFIELAGNYPITVNLDEIEIKNNIKRWSIEIEDCGTGISAEDLKFLMNTGSSNKNRKKARIIESMPYWIRPSGVFGIGFQSVFMLTDRVVVETKSFFDEIFQTIELNGPHSKRKGDILIKRSRTDHSKKPGTKLSMIFESEIEPRYWSVKIDDGHAYSMLHSYDPFTHTSLDIETGKIIDEVLSFSRKSRIPIKLLMNGKLLQKSTLRDNHFNYFDEQTSMELNVVGIKPFERIANTRTYYKGQEVDNNWHIEFLSFEVNIHQDKASDILTLNRNKIKSESNQHLKDQFFKASFNVILKNFNLIFNDLSSRAVASMYLDYYSDSANMPKEVDSLDFWKTYEIEISGRNVSIKDISEWVDKLSIICIDGGDSLRDPKVDLVDSHFIITTRSIYMLGSVQKFILSKLLKKFNKARFTEDKENQKTTVVFTFDNVDFYHTDEELYCAIEKQHNGYYYSRFFIPCIAEFASLRLRDNAHRPYIQPFQFVDGVNFPFPKMLSPFLNEFHGTGVKKMTTKLNDSLYEWVYENRYNSETSLEQIKSAYAAFCEKINSSQRFANID
ncbi:MAG: ATP-binding protein [Taibaiella sp.]|nr:ATP-binding protein [Taibaiella sp.]